MTLKSSSTLPALPVVPAVKGKEWPNGFRPLRDKATLTRVITISSSTMVTAFMETEGGKSNISVNTKGPGLASDKIPVVDVPAAVVAMNILQDWIKEENDRYVVQQIPEPEPVKGKTKGMPASEDEDEDDEDDLKEDDD